MSDKKEGGYEATITILGWLDFKRVVPGIKWPQIPGQTELFADFVRWLHEQKLQRVFTTLSGPSMLHQGYMPEDALKIERWLEDHGIEVQYQMEKDPPANALAFDDNDTWVDDDLLNPCRTPPGYRMLGLDESIQAGDIYWHPCWTKWFKLDNNAPATARILNMPVARREDQ